MPVFDNFRRAQRRQPHERTDCLIEVTLPRAKLGQSGVDLFPVGRQKLIYPLIKVETRWFEQWFTTCIADRVQTVLRHERRWIWL